MHYIFKSQRLGFRTWDLDDLADLYEMNQDDHVMQFFPKKYSEKDCENFIEKMNNQFKKDQYCYFAVDCLEKNEFIGFIGLSQQEFEADFMPSVDIGWRLKRKSWKKGYATEGAKQCLEYGFNQLNLKEIISIAPIINKPSESVMKRIGMHKIKEFKHPLLHSYPSLQNCIVYKIKKH
ncbi:ribosomal-protein-alanine N-acetyltransferase [Flavobacteriaceae bacterium UJ101]|nr:ribosomal-protein-alanine N-acetyltransferase [Flavobacteriaceae bacterium UJ101]